MSREFTFNFSGYEGWDMVLALLPKKRQAKTVAKAVIKNLLGGNRGARLDFEETPVFLNMPWGTYKILDAAGTVQPCAKERTPGL